LARGGPDHAQNDDLSVEVPAFKHIFDRDERLHLFIIARTLAFAPEPAHPSVRSVRTCFCACSITVIVADTASIEHAGPSVMAFQC